MKRKNKTDVKMKRLLKRCTVVILWLICIIPSLFGLITYAAGGERSSVSVPMAMYHPPLDQGFTLTNKTDSTVYGSTAYTSLSIEVQNGSVVSSTYNGFRAYGISGSGVAIKLKLNHSGGSGHFLNGSQQWTLGNDSWGETQGQTVNGVTTGRIGSGAVVVQTSIDGYTWSGSNQAQYTDGLYTTDFAQQYGTKWTTVYTPSGTNLSRGIYVRVLYAYEVCDPNECTHTYKDWHGPFYYTTEKRHDNDNVWENYVEAYTFYLCNNMPETVTFHNLSVTDKLPQAFPNADAQTIQAYKQAETLTSGAGTVTGFAIDNSLNSAATIQILRNGSPFDIPSDLKVRTSGRYDITVTTPIGTQEKTVIYVDSADNEESMATYFGPGFLYGSKRIYSEGELPVYEGGKTYYSLSEVSDFMLPVSGTIRNLTTGSVIAISKTRSSKFGALTEAGEYEVTLTTNPFFSSDETSGDARVFTFRFVIIAEGTAPGPQVNQRNLRMYATTNVQDCKPVYYGITFPSASKGYITLAFADHRSAVNYALAYEKGVVEKQADGAYLYTGIFSLNGKKREYNSAWDLTDAIHYFAEQAVSREFFDMSEQYSYLTLDKELTSSVENLRTLELERSVVVFASEEQRRALTDSGRLPLIYPKECAYLTVDNHTVVEYHDFEFIRDSRGYDSCTVSITDSKGKQFHIRYNEGVGKQLTDLGCATGTITIEEATVYGDVATYHATFVRPNDHAASFLVSYTLDGESREMTITQENDGHHIEANVFQIRNVTDSLDPYSIVKIVKDDKTQEQQIYTVDEIRNMTWNTVGRYRFTCVSRLGFTFDFSVNIVPRQEVYIDFVGEGTSSLSRIVTYYKEKKISLPKLARYGYTLSGYTDADGKIYRDVIAEINFREGIVLTPIWEPNQYTVSFDCDVPAMTVTYGKEYDLPVPAARTGYAFVGWVYDDVPLTDNHIAILLEGDVALTAKFEKTHVTVSFDTAGGDPLSPELWPVNRFFKLPIPTKEGYRFIAWIHNGEEYNLLFITDTEDALLTAVWEKIPKTQKGSATSHPSDSHSYGSSVSFGVPNGSHSVTSTVVQCHR